MRIIHQALAFLLLVFLPLAGHAAGGALSVRAIGFTATKEKGPTDPKLAPYESTLRGNLPFESFRYVGESSASVSAGGNATLSLPNGGRVQLEGAGGTVKVHRGSTVVEVSPGRPAVFMTGSGKNDASGVIIMAQ